MNVCDRLKISGLTAALLLSFPASTLAQPPTSVPITQIGAGQSVWVDSVPGEEFTLINARVDIGTLKPINDELEVQMQWPASPGLVQTYRESHPELTLSDDNQFIDRERVICRPDGTISFRVESLILAADGKVIYRKAFQPGTERAKAEATAERLKTSFSSASSYGSDPRSLVCWAAARQCQKQDFTWPPPPNEAPLNDSTQATQMRAAYNQKFVPTCLSGLNHR